MRPYPECGLCTLKWIYERVTNSLGDEQRFFVFKRLADVIAKELDSSINLGVLCNMGLDRVHEFVLSSSRAYELLKRKSNEAAEQLIREAKEFIENSETPKERFEKACGLAAVSNVAPISAPSSPFEFSMVENIIKGRAPLPEAAGDIYAAASQARNVFYVADNAGEIGFDSLVISLLKEMGSKVVLVVKEGPFFDDATLEDVHYFGLEKIADTVSCVRGGIFVPNEKADELTSLFKSSDFIISKGTGNFESLEGNTPKKRSLFLLKAKCPPVSKETNTPKGKFVIRLQD